MTRCSFKRLKKVLKAQGMLEDFEAMLEDFENQDILERIESIELNKAWQAHEEKHWREYVRLHCPSATDEDVPHLVARCQRVNRRIRARRGLNPFAACEEAMHRLFDDYNNHGL